MQVCEQLGDLDGIEYAEKDLLVRVNMYVRDHFDLHSIIAQYYCMAAKYYNCYGFTVWYTLDVVFL